jgi:hypothetical protein
VRHVIYLKGLEDEFDIVSPGTVGGLTSDTYKAMNPQCKMPLLLMPDGTSLPESEVCDRPAKKLHVVLPDHLLPNVKLYCGSFE